MRNVLGLNIFTDSINKDIMSKEDVLKLQADHSIFNLGADRMVLELNRLRSQQKMADLVNEILLILKKHD